MTFSPTPEQQAIIDHIREKPSDSLLVSARAGSAKTSTIVLAAQEIRVRPALALAFNKRIQEELAERLPKDFDTKTMNGLGHSAWSRVATSRLSVDSDKLFKLAKAETQDFRDEDLISEVLALTRRAKSTGLVPNGAPMRRTGLLPDHPDIWADFAFERGFELREEALEVSRRVLLASIKQAYAGTIDFDDQIYMPVLFGASFPSWHTVIVDEAQDLSPLNHIMLTKCCAKRLIAIGDPYQAIYAFRGADSNSMTNLREAWAKPMTELGLTYSFRVPHIVSKRQRAHVSDFKSWPSVGEGIMWLWSAEGSTMWKLSDIPAKGAILCRNNAPLMKLAFALIKARRPVRILGRDIGASLATLLRKICKKQDSMSMTEAHKLVVMWEAAEREKWKDSPAKADTASDRAECLFVLLEASGAPTVERAVDFIKTLFADKAEGLVLSSIHRAKGLEFDWVMHLDPFRIPSKQSRRAEERGDPGPISQEFNLKYVCETRTKHTLVLANLEDCKEIA